MEEKQREVDLHYTTGRYAVMWVSPCMYCKHLIEDGYLDYTGWRCKAFPEGIDPAIVAGKKRHDEQIEGDKGFMYAPEISEDEEGTFFYDWDGKIVEVQ